MSALAAPGGAWAPALLPWPSPLLALAGAGAAAAAAAVLRRPDLAAPLVLFLLYSNLPAVGVAFHGVPKALAATFPLLLLVPLARDLCLLRAGLVLTPTFALLVLLLAVQLAGAVFAVDGARALGIAGTFALEGLLLYLLVVHVLRSAESLRAAAWALVAAGLLMTAVPIAQQASARFDSDFGGLGQLEGAGFHSDEASQEAGVQRRQPRLSGTIGETNRFAQVLLVLVPIALSLARTARARSARLAAGLCAAAIALGFALAFSRGGAVGALCLALAGLALRAFDGRKLLLAAGGVALVLALAPQYGERLRSLPTAIEVLRGDEQARAADGAARRRFTSMVAAARVFADHAWIGAGPGMFKEHSQAYGNEDALRRIEGGRRAHSLFLELAAEGGALGLSLFLGALACSAHALARARRASAAADPALADLCTACLLALVAYLGTGLFLHLSYLRYFCLLLALCDAAALVALRAAGRPLPPAAASGGRA